MGRTTNMALQNPRRNIYPNHTKRQVIEWKITTFFKSYWLLMVIIIGLSAGLWLNYQMNKQVCGLQAVQCIGE